MITRVPVAASAVCGKAQLKTVEKDLTQTKRKGRITREKVDAPAEEGVYGVVAIAGEYDTGGSSNKLVVFEGDGRLPIGDLPENDVHCPQLQRKYNSTYNSEENLPLIQAMYDGAATEDLMSFASKVTYKPVPSPPC